VTVCPFYSSRADIKPSRYIPPWWAFMPPSQKELEGVYNLGYTDTRDWLLVRPSPRPRIQGIFSRIQGTLSRIQGTFREHSVAFRERPGNIPVWISFISSTNNFYRVQFEIPHTVEVCLHILNQQQTNCILRHCIYLSNKYLTFGSRYCRCVYTYSQPATNQLPTPTLYTSQQQVPHFWLVIL
jgi:hypothetical protein